MKQVQQSFDELAASLTAMESSWQDDVAVSVIEKIKALPHRTQYVEGDLHKLLGGNRESLSRAEFEVALTVCRLFLDLSQDRFEPELESQLGEGGIGVKRFKRDPEAFVRGLVNLGVLNQMTEVVNTPLLWSDLLVERLKGGRGRAVSGQKRGRSLEDFVQERVREVFGDMFEPRCSFVGKDGTSIAKADFAIPSKSSPRIVIEAKGYGATGSKQTDVLGDLQKIIATKRADTTLLFVTDGLTWRRRTADLKKIVALQNSGEVARIYTRAMVEEMTEDLKTLRAEHGL